jgi:cytochrome c oxidase subunit 4
MAEKKKAKPQATSHDHDRDDEAPEHEREAHEEAAGDHGKAAHVAGHHGHGHAPNIREYMVIFVVLAVLTVIEVAITRPELHIARVPMTLALIGLALTKAAIVALYYMHLKHETKVLKMTVFLPMAAPTLYALVLITEAAWRLTR